MPGKMGSQDGYDPTDHIDPTGLGPFLSYAQLKRILIYTGIQAHHILERRFVVILLRDGCILDLAASIPLSPEDHQVFTNKWREEFKYGRTCATAAEIIAFAVKVYADRPEVLEWLKGAFAP